MKKEEEDCPGGNWRLLSRSWRDDYRYFRTRDLEAVTGRHAEAYADGLAAAAGGVLVGGGLALR